MDRFRDTRDVDEEVLDEILVRCPRCGGRAVARPREVRDSEQLSGGRLFRPRRLVCPRCAHVADWPASRIRWYPYHTDPYFHAELWLQVPCVGRTLRAYNARHLDVRYRFVRATLRERDDPGGAAPRNATLASRVPRWMKEAKRREAILSCIAELRSMLPERP